MFHHFVQGGIISDAEKIKLDTMVNNAAFLGQDSITLDWQQCLQLAKHLSMQPKLNNTSWKVVGFDPPDIATPQPRVPTAAYIDHTALTYVPSQVFLN